MGRQRLRLEIGGRAKIMQISMIVNTRAVCDTEQSCARSRSPASETLASPRSTASQDFNFVLVWLFIGLFPCAHVQSLRQAGNELIFSGPQVPISKKGSLISTPTRSHEEEHNRKSPCPHGEHIFMWHTDIKSGITKLLV